jgi:hypothetical protein
MAIFDVASQLFGESDTTLSMMRKCIKNTVSAFNARC